MTRTPGSSIVGTAARAGLALVAIFVIHFLRAEWTDYSRFWNEGLNATATVTAVSGLGSQRSVTVSFRDLADVEHSADVTRSVHFHASLKVGDIVQVRYLAADPKTAAALPWRFPEHLALAALCICLAALWYVLSSMLPAARSIWQGMLATSGLSRQQFAIGAPWIFKTVVFVLLAFAAGKMGYRMFESEIYLGFYDDGVTRLKDAIIVKKNVGTPPDGGAGDHAFLVHFDMLKQDAHAIKRRGIGGRAIVRVPADIHARYAEGSRIFITHERADPANATYGYESDLWTMWDYLALFSAALGGAIIAYNSRAATWNERIAIFRLHLLGIGLKALPLALIGATSISLMVHWERGMRFERGETEGVITSWRIYDNMPFATFRFTTDEGLVVERERGFKSNELDHPEEIKPGSRLAFVYIKSTPYFSKPAFVEERTADRRLWSILLFFVILMLTVFPLVIAISQRRILSIGRTARFRTWQP